VNSQVRGIFDMPGTITVRVRVTGRETVSAFIDEGGTVLDAVSSLQIPTDGMKVEVNGEPAQFTQRVEANALIELAPKVTGGGKLFISTRRIAA